jgi:hypothetical protein
MVHCKADQENRQKAYHDPENNDPAVESHGQEKLGQEADSEEDDQKQIALEHDRQEPDDEEGL